MNPSYNVMKQTVEVSGRMLTIKVEIDGYPESPREWDNLGHMACVHERYNLGDKSGKLGFNMKNLVESYESWDEVEEHLVENYDAKVILPVFMYDHSGISLSCSPFGCRWDSGQVGFIYTTSMDIAKAYKDQAWTEEEVRACLLSEVNVYSSYVNGEVYGYVIEDEQGGILDSCFGFIESAQEVMEQGLSEAQYMT